MSDFRREWVCFQIYENGEWVVSWKAWKSWIFWAMVIALLIIGYIYLEWSILGETPEMKKRIARSEQFEAEFNEFYDNYGENLRKEIELTKEYIKKGDTEKISSRFSGDPIHIHKDDDMLMIEVAVGFEEKILMFYRDPHNMELESVYDSDTPKETEILNKEVREARRLNPKKDMDVGPYWYRKLKDRVPVVTRKGGCMEGFKVDKECYEELDEILDLLEQNAMKMIPNLPPGRVDFFMYPQGREREVRILHTT